MIHHYSAPEPLSEGSLIAIVSPASAVRPELIAGAADALCSFGFRVDISPNAASRSGSYSAPVAVRLAEMQQAIDNPDVAAILCGRGGYGAVHLLDSLRVHRPVWLIGFSDISALHALWLRSGFRSIHASMAKELALRRSPSDEATARLLRLLRSGRMPEVSWAPSALNRPGRASGPLLGGNLAVLDGLADTPYNIIGLRDSILVIEDVAEPIYKVERILHRLRLAGTFNRIAGLVVGQFTLYEPDANGESMEQMIARMVAPFDFPVAFNAPFGHIEGNLPFVEGCPAEFIVDADGAHLLEHP